MVIRVIRVIIRMNIKIHERDASYTHIRVIRVIRDIRDIRVIKAT